MSSTSRSVSNLIGFRLRCNIKMSYGTPSHVYIMYDNFPIKIHWRASIKIQLKNDLQSHKPDLYKIEICWNSISTWKWTVELLARSMSTMITVHLKSEWKMSSGASGKIHIKSSHFELRLKRKMSSTAPSKVCTKSVHF